MNKWILCFLGNPGKKYEKTRHNIGWQLEQSIEEWTHLNWKEKFKGKYSIWNELILLKPETMMNLSGISLQKAMTFFQVPLSNILIVHDDLELPFGQFSWKTGGGLAGHNGLKSIEQQLKSRDFLRLRMGIGRPVHGSVSNWVLQPFSSEEQAELPNYLSRAAEDLLSWNRDRLQ